MAAAPNHLAVYLSNRCNLACSYCYVSVNQGAPAHLSFEDVKESVDYFLDEVPGADKKITFLGGEPFLNFPLLERMVRHARWRGGESLVLQTFTNGTLLTPERLEFLNDYEVYATISLDGTQRTNDAKRFFHGDKDRSVFAEVMARLKDIPKDNLGVSLVFNSGSVGELLPNIDFFYRMGFGRITFNPELYEAWSLESLEVLRGVMQGFARYYRLILEKNMRPFVIPILFSVLENAPKNAAGERWWHDCHNVVLGPDKQFYACDKALSFPIGEAEGQKVGNAAAGMDWDKRQEHFREAAQYIESRGWGKDESFCPMGVYFHSRQAGADPQPALENFHRVGELFAESLVGLARALEGHPVFEELYVRPRLV
ncbi:MAG: radical SAM protein [Elusimicrobia bacterium]|nr:radical SAM protein [Elusimicrobiota bacterium]